VTPEAFHAEMAKWLLGQGLALLVLVTGIVRWLLGREEERLLDKTATLLGTLMDEHDGEPRCHRAMVDAWEISRERALAKSLDVATSALKVAVVDALVAHNRDPWAHPEGSENRIGPLRASIDRLHETIGALDRRLAGLDSFIADMRTLKAEHDEILKNHDERLPRHPGRG
jgi:hypothetical protein